MLNYKIFIQIELVHENPHTYYTINYIYYKVNTDLQLLNAYKPNLPVHQVICMEFWFSFLGFPGSLW